MILKDGTEIDIGTHWEINIPCIINIERSNKNLGRSSSSSGFVELDFTQGQALKLVNKILEALLEYDNLEKSLGEYHAKPNTNE